MSDTARRGLLSSAWVQDVPDQKWSRLTHAECTDILIIGGGVAGVSTALNLALMGHNPILIEADRIGGGAAGASGGIVAPQLARHSPDVVIAKLGHDHATALLNLVAESGDYTFSLARTYAPGADARQSGFLAPATGAAGLRRLSAMADSWRPFRNDVAMLKASEFQSISGVRGYAGALHDSSGGTINPAGYVQDLARAAIAAGARIFTRSSVESLRRSGSSWVACTAEGRVAANRVILAANGGNPLLHPRLRGTILPMDVCEMTTMPLSPALRRQVLPSLHALTDMENDVFTIRYDRAGGLVTAYPASSVTQDRVRLTKAVNARLGAAIAGWEEVPLKHVWHGTASVNVSLIPRLVAVDQDMIAIQCCNGRGLAINSILGRDIARWLDGAGRVPPPLPLQPPQPVPGYFIARHVPQLTMMAGLLRKRVKQAFNGGAKGEYSDD